MAVDGLGNVFVANGVGVRLKWRLLYQAAAFPSSPGRERHCRQPITPLPPAKPAIAPVLEPACRHSVSTRTTPFSGVPLTSTSIPAAISGRSAWTSQAVVHMVGLAAPVAAPASAVYPGINTITAWSSSTSNCGPGAPGYYTITFTVPNNFKAPQSISEGQYVLLSGFGGTSGGFLIDQQVEVLTATSTQFTACIAGGTPGASSSSGIGSVQYSLLGTRP